MHPRVAEGFRALDRLGWIREIPDADRYKVLATDYAAAVKAGEKTIVVSPTHAEGRLVTAEIRRLLKDQGTLRGGEREFRVLQNAQLTHAEKTDPVNFRPSDVAQFHQNAKGFRRGHRLAVGDGPLPLQHAERFTLFRSSHLALAPGDLIRITHGGSTADGKHRLENGAVFTVKNFDRKGNIILENGWKISRSFGHIAHGYVTTSHASQGRTVDRVFIAQNSDSGQASSREQFYVSASRAKRQATIYTDSKAALLEAVSRSDDRVSATELADAGRRREVMKRFAQLNVDREQPQMNRERELSYER